jgi:hypothetical protein
MRYIVRKGRNPQLTNRARRRKRSNPPMPDIDIKSRELRMRIALAAQRSSISKFARTIDLTPGSLSNFIAGKFTSRRVSEKIDALISLSLIQIERLFPELQRRDQH